MPLNTNEPNQVCAISTAVGNRRAESGL